MTMTSNESSPYNHNRCLVQVAGTPNGFMIMKKVLEWGLTLEQYQNEVVLVNRIGPHYERDWADTRYGSNQFTALHAAAFEGHISSVILLLKQGWSWWAKDKDGRNVLDILRQDGFDREAALIEKKFREPIDKTTSKKLKRQQKEALRKERYGESFSSGMKNGRKLKPIKKLNYEELAKESESDEETPRYETPRKIDQETLIQDEVTRRIRAEMKARALNLDMREVFSP